MEWLNFRHLYAFWMVARAGSFTKAAEELLVAQSAISAQVAALEGYLREPLLYRHPRATSLTPAGRELMSFADTIFAQSRALNALFRENRSALGHRRLRIGIVGGASRNFVYRLLEDLVQRTEGLYLSVSSGSYEELSARLVKFDLDAIISLEPPQKKDMAEVTYRKLGETAMCLAGIPSIIRTIQRETSHEAVTVYKFRHPYEVDILGKYVRPQYRCAFNLRLDTDDIPLLRFFANGGRGVALLPRAGIIEDIESGTLEALDIPSCPAIPIYGIIAAQTNPFVRVEELFTQGGRDALDPVVSESTD